MENGKNIIKKGEVIFAQGDTVSHIGIVLAGKVLMQNEWMRLVRWGFLYNTGRFGYLHAFRIRRGDFA